MPLEDDAISEILPFAPQAQEVTGDLMPLDEYKTLPQRLTGFVSGLARRAIFNRAHRQSAHMAAGLAQFIANRYGPGVLDDGDLDKIEAGLDAAVQRYFASRSILTDSPLTGGGELSADLTLGINTAGPAEASAPGSLGATRLAAINDTTSNDMAATPAGVAAQVAAVSTGYELGEFYFFRHPTLKPGFRAAQGGLLANAATLYPEIWAYLQTTDGQLLCKTEAQWQAMTTAIWATLADGSTVGWNGIGGAPFYAPNTATGALRLPDLRGMYAEAAGFDALGVGGVDGDRIREIAGQTGAAKNTSSGVVTTGAFGVLSNHGSIYGPGSSSTSTVAFAASRVVPTGSVTAPRRWGALACVYLGQPAA